MNQEKKCQSVLDKKAYLGQESDKEFAKFAPEKKPMQQNFRIPLFTFPRNLEKLKMAK